MENRNAFLAHVREAEPGQWKEHSLEDHLRAVAKEAAGFAAPFGNRDWAGLAGLWHDLGKYRADFQAYIRGASGYDPNAHVETARGRVDHSTAGAILATDRLDIKGRILAYLIAGHHAGLPDWTGDRAGRKALVQRIQKRELLDATLAQPIPADILRPTLPSSGPARGADFALWIRMLFSCLVDADFLDTERFMDPARAVGREGYPPLAELLPRFEVHLQRLEADARPSTVNRLRSNVLRRCMKQASRPPGLFSLTVPTGGGKTLSSMAFALRHALVHGKRRIIYVIPYTSIIEQTARVFRGIFDEAVLEHHSNLDSTQEDYRSRLACENWDAPIVVTTAVQFFESLFANRTSRVRKLHNIVDSVVVLDEAQLLPPDFLKPILRAIEQLKAHYGVSFVLCTATQPALGPHRTFDWRFDGLPDVQEIMENPKALHEALRRVEVTVPDDLLTGTSWQALAAELTSCPSVLCIVDRRDDCRELHRLMTEGTLHLSGLMCGQHRAEVIDAIKQRLQDGEEVRVISTQLVEAGVDMDFPVVYRALAGLDSIAQAAGRCNREGLMAEPGRVVVFVPPKPAPRGHLLQAQQCGRQLLQQRPADPLAPEHFERYFRQLFWQKGDKLDCHGILEDLKQDNKLRFLFASAAAKFRIIDETCQAPVIVRYGKGAELIEQLRRHGPERWLLRRLQRFVVSLPFYKHQQLLNSGDVQELHPGLFVQAHDGLYHRELGLMGEDPAYYEPDTLII